MKLKSGIKRVCQVAVLGLSLATAARGQEVERKVDLHGFGDWRFGKTGSANDYLGGTKEGEYQQANLALDIAASLTDRLRVVSQVGLHEDQHEEAVDIDYAFAEWRLSDRLHLRAGKVKQPFGLYSEVFDVGTLRPFASLPQGVYGPVGLIGRAYKGLGLTGSSSLGKGWAIQYDVYGGGTDLDESVAPEEFLRDGSASDDAPIERELTRHVAGGRVSLETPVSGLRFGGAVYTGVEVGSNRRTGVGLHAEYLSDKVSARTEYGRESVKDDLLVNGFYAELAYRFDAHWQGAVQYDRLSTELPGADVSAAPSLLDHREVAVGLNYWFQPEFVLKASFHRVDKNRLAFPLLLDEAIAQGTLEPRTNLFLFSAQFSF